MGSAGLDDLRNIRGGDNGSSSQLQRENFLRIATQAFNADPLDNNPCHRGTPRNEKRQN